MTLRFLVFATLIGLSFATQSTGWRATPEVVARAAQQQPGFNYDEARVPAYTLPDPLKGQESVVSTPAQWRIRRAEILDLFRDTVYGRSPGRPEHLDFKRD